MFEINLMKHWEKTYYIKIIIPALLIILLPFHSLAWDAGSFKWVQVKELWEPIKWEIEHYEGKENLIIFVDRGPTVFETRKGEEYGYIVDAVVIHDVEREERYYLYCWDFEWEYEMAMRGIEPEYSKFEIVGDGLVRIEIRKKGIIDGYGIFDIRKPSFDYQKVNN